MKKFKHKTLPYEAEKDDGSGWHILRNVERKVKVSHWKSTSYQEKEWKTIERYTVLPKELIEKSDDREKIEAESWQEKTLWSLYDRYGKCVNRDWNSFKLIWEEVIKSYMPKITIQELEKMRITINRGGEISLNRIKMLVELLRKKWLLVEE